MELSSIVSLIGTLGFPIVACLCMGWFVKYQLDTNNKQIKEMNEEHRKEIKEVTKSLDNNTKVMQELIIYIKGENNNE